MTNVWGQEELDKTAVFWEASLDRPNIARKIVDAGEVIRGENTGRTDASQITYFKNCAFWGIGAAAIGGLIYDKLLQQRKGLVLDFNPHRILRRYVGGGLIRLKVPQAEAQNICW